MTERDREREAEKLLFTVASVWREERVSCPHPDVLRAWLGDSLAEGPAEFVAFHVRESQCPYCNAMLDEMRDRDEGAEHSPLDGLRERLHRSTIAALRDRAR